MARPDHALNTTTTMAGRRRQPSGAEHTSRRGGPRLRARRQGVALAAHLGVADDALEHLKLKREASTVEEDSGCGGASWCAAWFVHPMAKTCKGKTHEGLEVAHAIAGSRIEGRRRRIRKDCPTTMAEQ